MDRFILRAELVGIDVARESIVTYAYELTAESVFVVTDWVAPEGTRAVVRLGLPRALAPVEIPVRVVEHRLAGAPGELGGVRLAFERADPARAAAIDALLAEATRPAAHAGVYRVLLVEDNGLTRDVFQYSAGRYFGTPGAVAIDHAADAERAWELLANATAPYDIVVVDYILPTANGASLIAKLRGDPRLRGIPVVAISVGGHAARDATIAAGADLFVDKPLVFKDLFHTLQLLARVPAATADGAPRPTILVLDDSTLALAVTRAALEGAGFTVVIAEDLAAFERQRASCDPDLILVDLQMPEMYGDDIAAMLRGGQVDVPVLLFSSVEETELARRSAEANASGYIWKGAGTGELVRRCKELLEHAA